MTFEDGPLTRSCEVVIVGAGIVGLYTALLLKKQGINVQIYERQSVMYNMPKAMSLSDEMVRSFHLNGFSDLVNDHIVKAGAQSNNPYFLWTDADQNILSKFRNQAPGSSGYSAMSLFHQPNMEAYFILQCEAHNIPIYRRWTYTHNIQNDQDSNLTIYFDRNTKGQKDVYNRHVQVHCKWLIGCDGANSTVRTKANLKQQDLRFQYNWLVVDVLPNNDVAPSAMTWTQICNPKRPTTVIGEGTNGRRRFEFMVLDEESVDEISSPASTWKLLEPYHMNASNTEIERAAVYRFQALNTEDYWDGNKTVIAGDAAHLSPPFIGQGLNSGMRDAIGLSWRLCRILRNQSSVKLMQSYALERKLHTQHLIDIATSHGALICESNQDRAETLHSAMRQRYLANAEKEEPFLESMLPADGCISSEQGGGGIFINRPILPYANSASSKSQLFDQIITEKNGWRIFKLGQIDVNEEKTISQHFAFLGASVINIIEEQDFQKSYRSFLTKDNFVIIRPDQYVFAMFPTVEELYAAASTVYSRVCAV